MAHRKRTAAGRAERLQVLSRYESSSAELLQRALGGSPRWQVQADDVLDALVAFITAEAPTGTLRSLVTQPSRDECGLTMEMVYRDAS